MRINLQPGGIGDELAVTLLPRALREQKGETYVCIGTGFSHPDIFKHHPFVDPDRDGEKEATILHAQGWAEKTLPRKFGRQLGVDVGYGPPVIYFSDDELAEDFRLPDGKCVVAIDSYSTWGTRRWPVERFKDVAAVLLARGVVVVEVGKHRQPALPNTLTFRNKLSVRQTGVLLSRCSLFLGNDSGLMHLAAAVGTSQVVIYGVVRAKRRAYESTIPVESPEVCHPECRFACADGHADMDASRCLGQVDVGDVLSAIAKAVENKVGKVMRRA